MQRPRRTKRPECDIENGADLRHWKWKPEEYLELEQESEKKK